MKSPKPPTVKLERWVQSPIDRFILSELEARQLQPAEVADKRTLIRRATFDLIGIPPTPEEVTDFLADNEPDAFARVIERLLASPRYGERWGAALARRCAVRRLERAGRKPRARECVSVSRLGDLGVQSRSAVRRIPA